MKKMIEAVLLSAMILAPAGAAEVDRRLSREQARINQGVRSGSLNPRETASLERQEARIAHEIAIDRSRNGGRLTPNQWRSVNRQEDRLSRRIYNDKHNGR